MLKINPFCFIKSKFRQFVSPAILISLTGTPCLSEELTPLLWISEDQLLVRDSRTVSIFDTKTVSIENSLAKTESEKFRITSKDSCISSTGIVFYLEEYDSISGKWKNVSKRLEVDLRKLTNETVQRFLKSYGENSPFNCSKATRPYTPSPREITVDGEKYWQTHYALRRGFKISSGPEISSTVFEQSKDLKYVAVQIPLEGKSAKHLLIPMGECRPSDFQHLGSTWDPSRKMYFWYNYASNFERGVAKKQKYKGWWVKPDFTIDSEIGIPHGPWFRSYGPIKSLSCFSCGCSCYSQMELYSVNGAVFIQIYGRGVYEAELGIYKLNNTTKEWERIVEGETTPPTISPSGCRIAYQDSGLKFRNLCHS